MQVMVYEPNKPAELRDIPNTLKACQQVVGGYIQTVHLTPELLIVCNEEGWIRGMQPNRLGLVGPFFVCTTAGEDFDVLSEAQIRFLRRFLH